MMVFFSLKFFFSIKDIKIMSSLTSVKIPSQIIKCQNFISGQFASGSGEKIQVISPYNGKVIGEFSSSTKKEVESAIKEAQAAQILWADVPMKERTKIMFNFRNKTPL